MFSSLKSAASATKDQAVSFTIKKIINLKAEKFGATVTEFILDSSSRSIFVTFTLEDEIDPIELKAKNYEITTKNGHHFLEVEAIEKSREWKNSYIDGKRYKIPPKILELVKIVL